MRPPTAGEAAAAALAAPLAAWAGFVAAPALDGGGSLASLIAAFSDPFSTKPTAGGARWALLFLVLYAACAAAWLLTRRNLRPGEEHGSARWGDARRICHRYRGRDPAGDKLLTRNFRMSYDTHAHRRSMNTLVVGGSGAGKTRGFSLPNACQANTSMVVLDPKGEIVRAVGGLLESRGYEVRVLDLVRMERSHCYNPLSYIESDADAQRLNTNLFKATTPKGAQSQDPFWDTAAGMLHLALLLYLVHEAPPEERNYATLMEMLRAGEVREDDDDYASVLDELFDRLEMRDPGHIALKYYRSYRSGSAKTLKSIQVTLASRLEKFNLDALASLTATDELDLPSLGERKVALFAVIPDNDTSFNFLVSVLYTQLFQQLFALADGKHGGQLPVHVHFLMDEFANVSLPNDFEKILSTMRGRGVSASIIIQNMAQLRALFDKQWESIVGNCDEFLYLGGNEQSTHKYVSELLGKETIDLDTHGRTTGRGGSWSTNQQISGRELMTPDEVRMLDNSRALLFVRGERPIIDLKLDIARHPAARLTPEGGAPPYEHGACPRASAAVAPYEGVAPASAQAAPAGCVVLDGEEAEAALAAEAAGGKGEPTHEKDHGGEEGPPRSPRAAHGGNRRLRRFGLGAGAARRVRGDRPDSGGGQPLHVHLRAHQERRAHPARLRRGAGGHVAQEPRPVPARQRLPDPGGRRGHHVREGNLGYHRRIGPSRGPRKEAGRWIRTTGWSATSRERSTRGTRRWARSWGCSRRRPPTSGAAGYGTRCSPSTAPCRRWRSRSSCCSSCRAS